MDLLRLDTAHILTALGGLLIAYTLLSILLNYLSEPTRYLHSQAWIGLQQSKYFAKYHATLSSISKTREWIFEGYTRFSKNNLVFVLPQVGSKSFLLLPPTKVKELAQKSDDEIDLQGILNETVAAYWTGDTDIAGSHIHLDVIKHQLTRKLNLVTEDVWEELKVGFEVEWEVKKGEWRTVVAAESCATVVSRAANRVFSGPVLCRNPEFLLHSRLYGLGIFSIAATINMFPSVLRPFFAPILVARNRRHLDVCQRIAAPSIKQRLEETQHGEIKEPRNDALQWIIENCIKSGDPAELDITKICRRLMRLNMVAVHTTTVTITNALLDLYSSPHADEFVEGLREECTTVLAAHGGQWTKAAVNDLMRIDSTIRESMRLNTLSIVGFMREVTKPGGIDLSGGIHIPKGVRIGVPNAAVQRDPAYYQNPDEYDAFRFARNRETLGENGQLLEKRSQGIVSTGESFLPFGHGRHACPGRFFASQEMKLMLAYIVLHYDVKVPGPRPPNFDIKAMCMPSPKARLMVRLRE